MERKPGQQCVLDFTPTSFQGQSHENYLQDEMAGVYKHKDHIYVSKRSFKKHCNMMDDIQAHPILSFFLKVIAGGFSILMICLLFTCCKYKSVSNRYEELRSREPSESQIVNRS